MRKIIVGMFIFLLFGVSLVFSNNSELTGTGKTDEKKENKIKEILISERQVDVNIGQGEKNIVLNSGDYNQTTVLTSRDGLIYTYQNIKGEVIYFSGNGKYCNTNTGVCHNIRGFESGQINIFDQRDYIVFFVTTNQGPRLFIFSKENEKVLSFDLNFNIGLSFDYYSNQNVSYIVNNINIQNVSFDVYDGNLRIYFVFGESDINGEKYKGFSQVVNINFSKLNKENFNSDIIYRYVVSGKYYDDEFKKIKNYNSNLQYLRTFGDARPQKFYRDVTYREKEEDSISGFYVDDYTARSNYFTKFKSEKKIDIKDFGVKIGYNFNHKGEDLVETYLNSRGLMGDLGIAYVDDYTSFYSGRDGKLYHLWVETSGENQYVIKRLFDGFLGLSFINFHNYRILSVKQDEDGYFYISYMIDGKKLNTLVSKKLYNLKTKDIDYKVIENKYYLGNFNGIKIFFSDSGVSLSQFSNFYFPVFYMGRYGNDYTFMKFYTFDRYNYFLGRSHKRIFSEEEINFNFGGNFNLGNNPIKHDHDKLNKEGDEIRNNEEVNSGILEEIKDKISGMLGSVGDIFQFFFIPFPSEKDVYSVSIPGLQFKNNSVDYQSLRADLPNFSKYKDLVVVNVSDSDGNSLGKKFISFLLGVIYILIRFFLVLFFFIPFILYYLVVEKITGSIFGGLGTAGDNGGTVTKIVSFLYYGIVFSSIGLMIASLFVFIPMFNIGFDYINNIFGYVLHNYLDYSFFIVFVNGFFIFLSVGVFSHLAYIYFKNK